MRVQAVNANGLNQADEISINFSGRGENFPQSTVLNAKEGESKNFKIMDISRERIVLKEVGTSTNDRSVAEKSKSIKEEINKEYSVDLNNESTVEGRDFSLEQSVFILSSETIKQIESEGKLIENMSPEELSESIIRVWDKAFRSSISAEDIISNKEDLPSKTEQEVVDKVMKEIAELLNISVFDSHVFCNIIDKNATKYITENNLKLTVENIYKAIHAGSVAVDTGIKDEDFKNILSQIESVLNQSGMEVTEENLDKAKWLINNQLPVTYKNLKTLDDINKINNYSSEDIYECVANAVKFGTKAKEINLAISNKDIISIQQSIESISDEAIEKTVNDGKVISIKNLSITQKELILDDKIIDKNMETIIDTDESTIKEINYDKYKRNKNIKNDQDYKDRAVTDNEIEEKIEIKNQIKIRLQLEEIRLRMTYNSNYKLTEKGIDIQTTELSKLVEELRNIDNSYYNSIYQIDSNGNEIEVLKEVLTVTNDIKYSPVDVISATISVQDTITLRQFHIEATNIKEKYADNAYETMMTKPRGDLGDSIKKAFRNVDDILNDLNLDVNEFNQRAVRILGYNNMDINSENIDNIKSYDLKVRELITNLVPKVAVELIRNNINPLDMTIDDLNNKIIEIKENDRDAIEEDYNRFLWKMDHNNSITEQEREGYIGIYRLVNAITKSDGAVIGAVVNADMDFTLSNLLTSYRTIRNKGIDVKVDKKFGVVDSVTVNGKSIADQINNAFTSNAKMESTSVLLRMLGSEITPEKLLNLEQHDIDYLNVSIEELVQVIGEEKIDDSGYYEEKLQKFKDIIKHSDNSNSILNKIGIDSTINNLLAMNNIQNNDALTGSIKKLLKNNKKDVNQLTSKSDNIDKIYSATKGELQNDLEKIISEMPSSIIDKETMIHQYEKMTDVINNMINNEIENGNFTTNGFEQMRALGQNIRFALKLSKKECYEIPLIVNEQVTNINLTVISNGDTKNRVNVDVDSEKLGRINASFVLKNNEVKGFILSESRKTLDFIKNNISGLEDMLIQQDLQLLNIDYGIKGRKDFTFEAENSDNNVSNKQLYGIAKAMVITIREMERKDVI